MISHETIQKILELAVYAPSGDNSQPWRFEVEGNRIDIFTLHERDNPFYNFRQNGSLVACGCLIENIVITAPEFGYNTLVKLFPKKEENNLIASILIESREIEKDILYPYISKRVTNRKKYQKKYLTQKQKQALVVTSEEIGKGTILIIEDKDKIKRIANLVSVNERVVLETHGLHEYFFNHIRWNWKEEEKEKSGLYIKTLELNPIQRFVFRLYRHWLLAKIFNSIGLSKFIAKDNSKLYASSGAFCAIVMDSDTRENFIDAGRIMQRIWLKTTAMGLSLQLVTGVLFLMQRILGKGTDIMSKDHISLVQQSYEDIKKTYGISDGIITLLFRIGYGDMPSARSSRQHPVILFK